MITAERIRELLESGFPLSNILASELTEVLVLARRQLSTPPRSDVAKTDPRALLTQEQP